jgi:predicted GTPase
MTKIRVLIMGAAGRDFHNFNTFYRARDNYDVVCFTATQIPDIEGRIYPPSLAGPNYPDGIPIYPEEKLVSLIKEKDIDQVVFAYSDVSHEYVMHIASTVLSCGADFRLMGMTNTALKYKKPIISVCAIRTGCGKSQTTSKVCQILKKLGKKVVVVRHPMPYGDLEKQKVQRFSSIADLEKFECTIEEQEEYERHILNGIIVYAGVDYAEILKQAEEEADIVIWDGGNNDMPFYDPDIDIVVVDPHRPGHEVKYFPGEVNFKRADIIVINKVDTADREDVLDVEENIKKFNPRARVIKAASPITVLTPEKIVGKRVLVVEDGPTLTHGEMKYGAGTIAAQNYGAREIIDPRPYAVGKIKKTFEKYPTIGTLLPAMGYGKEQIEDLQKTINKTPADLVVSGTPIDLSRIINTNKEILRISYELSEIGSPNLEEILTLFVKNLK